MKTVAVVACLLAVATAQRRPGGGFGALLSGLVTQLGGQGQNGQQGNNGQGLLAGLTGLTGGGVAPTPAPTTPAPRECFPGQQFQRDCNTCALGSSMSFLSRSEYDRGVNTFSPEGRLFQVEYAIEAIKLGSTAIGVCTKEGVVLVVEKRVTSTLIDPTSIEKLLEIDEHMGCAMSGLTADARTLVDHARVEAQSHWFTYNERMPIESNVNAIADLALDFSDSDKKKRTMSRPFGVALLVGGVDPTDGPVLFNTDPSGTFTKYSACAIGSAQEGATSMLQEQYNKDMTLKEAEILALTVLRQVMEEKLSKVNIEVANIPLSTGMFTPYTQDQLEDIIGKLPAPSQPTLSTAGAGQ